MKKRKKQRFVALIILFITICCSIITSPDLPTSTVHAEIKGTEDATNADSFDTEKDQNMYKAWSVLKCMSYTDAQACAVLGCWLAESGNDFCPYSVEAQWINYSILDKDNYINNVSKNYVANHESYSQFVFSKTKDADPSGYVGSDGTHWCGIGLAQWTATRAEDLTSWADSNSADWWEMDNQLIWAFLGPDNGGDTNYPWEQYAEETAGKDKETDIEACVKDFFGLYELPKARAGACSVKSGYEKYTSPRTTYSKTAWDMFHGKGWDQNYGNSILEGTGLAKSTIKDGIIDKGVKHEKASVVLYYPLNEGYLLAEDGLDTLLATKNQEVYKGYINSLQGYDDTSTRYSLFELYGEDIHWYRYLGEQTYAPKLLDHLWSAWDEDRVDKLKVLETIFYSPPNYLSCNVYKDRPRVLTDIDLDNNYSDPRAEAMKGSWFNGFSYVLGSIDLTIAKFFVSLTAVLLGPDIMVTLKDILNTIETGPVWETLQPVMIALTGFAIISFIFSMVKKGANYATGKGSAKEAVLRFFTGFIALGLLFTALYKPTALNEIMYKVTTSVDSFFSKSLAESGSMKNDEVIGISADSAELLTVRAILWKTAIFGPWCRGQFDGKEYNELYTYYEDVSMGNKERMYQSNDEIPEDDDTADTPYFNSVKYTGDVTVPIGNGKLVRNWAAYLYSCGSQYHLDYNLSEEEVYSEIDPSKDIKFPAANTTAYNTKIMADTFRVIDAQMNIAPQEYGDGTIVDNYTKAHTLDFDFVKEGSKMLVNTVLLVFFIPVIISKLKNYVLLIITTLQIIYHSFLEIFKEGSGFKEYLNTLKNAAIGFFLACLKANVMLILYMKFADQGFAKMLIYILLCLVVLGFNKEDAVTAIHRAKHAAGNLKRKI